MKISYCANRIIDALLTGAIISTCQQFIKGSPHANKVLRRCYSSFRAQS